MLALFPILYAVILSCLPKTNHRYFLPDTLIFCTLAVFGLFCFILGDSARLTRAVQVVGFLAALGISVADLIPYEFAFRVDARQQLAFIRQKVSPDATIAQDRRRPSDPRLPSCRLHRFSRAEDCGWPVRRRCRQHR